MRWKVDSKVNCYSIFISNTRLVLVSKLISRLFYCLFHRKKRLAKKNVNNLRSYLQQHYHESFVSYVTKCFKTNRFIITFAK